MGIMEYSDCANARAGDYRELIEFVEEQAGEGAEAFWLQLKEWVDSLDPWVLAAVTYYLGGNKTVIINYINRALGVVMSAAALEVAAAVALGLGLGVAIDLIRECGDQLVA